MEKIIREPIPGNIQLETQNRSLYFGTDDLVLNLLKSKRETFNIKDFEQAQKYLKRAATSYDWIAKSGCGYNRVQIGDLVYPKLVISDLELKTSEGGIEYNAWGVVIVKGINDFSVRERAYLLVEDSRYDSDGGLRRFCDEQKIPIIEKSKLAEKLNELGL
jgi:hypothetical protein